MEKWDCGRGLPFPSATALEQTENSWSMSIDGENAKLVVALILLLHQRRWQRNRLFCMFDADWLFSHRTLWVLYTSVNDDCCAQYELTILGKITEMGEHVSLAVECLVSGKINAYLAPWRYGTAWDCYDRFCSFPSVGPHLIWHCRIVAVPDHVSLSLESTPFQNWHVLLL